MEEIKILYSPKVSEFLNDLVLELYLNEYFGFEEEATAYKDKIIDFIETMLGRISQRQTPFILRNLGRNYIFYRANHRTTWYIFFEQSETNFVVTSIINNHSGLAKFLNLE